MRALALLGLTGCSTIFGLDGPAKRQDASVEPEVIDARVDARIDAPPNAPPLCSDNFNDNALDARWSLLTSTAHTFAEQNQRLEIMLVAAANRRTGIELPLVGDSHVVRVEAVQALPNSPQLDMYLGLYKDDQNYVELIFENATLIARVMKQGSLTDNGKAYDANTDRLWEIEITPLGVVTFRAGNGAILTEVHQDTVGFSFDGGKVALYGRTNQLPVFGGTGAFDNFSMMSPACTP